VRFFPSYGYGEPPRRAQQRVGSGGYTQYKGSSADGGGGVTLGVVDNPNDDYDAYGYISFDTGWSTEVYGGWIGAVKGNHGTYGDYGHLTLAGPEFHNDKIRPKLSFVEYDNGSSHGGKSYIAIGQHDTNTGVVNGAQNHTYWNRDNAGNYTQHHYGDAWYWFDNPTTGTSWTTLMSLNTSGNLAVAGSLSKGSGSFDIPHPVTEGKRLRHSFIEGPYADLIYRGTVTLGAEPVTICMDEQYGMAEGTWKALNTNPWSMVSASGKLVEWSLDECKLTITGDEGTVCQWMVIGERKDQHMIDTDSTDNDGRLVLEYTPTAEPEDIHDIAITNNG